jgi:hypothetical protein
MLAIARRWGVSLGIPVLIALAAAWLLIMWDERGSANANEPEAEQAQAQAAEGEMEVQCIGEEEQMPTPGGGGDEEIPGESAADEI